MNTRRIIARLAKLFERLDLQYDRDHPEAIVAALERDVEFEASISGYIIALSW